MRIPHLYLEKNGKSLNKTQKVIRTITKTNAYIHKQQKQKAEMEQEILAKLKKQKEFDKEFIENLERMIEYNRVSEIQYLALILYGKRIDNEKALEIIKARKAK